MVVENFAELSPPENEFFDRLAQNPRPVIVDFWAPWCGPCRVVEPVLKKIGAEYDGQVDVWKINADEYPELLRQLRILSIPTLIGFNGEQEIARQTGAGAPGEIEALFEVTLSGEPLAEPAGVKIADRVMRLTIALALLFLAFIGEFKGVYVVFAISALVVAFSAVYDRCPIWQAIAPRIKGLLGDKQVKGDDPA
jgi:thioredoxin 1